MESKQTTTSLNEQIRRMLAGMGLPEEFYRVIGQAIAELRAAGVGSGLTVGTKAPDFRLSNQADEQVSLSGLLDRGPVVLKFIRGAWCPICNLEVAALQRILPQLEQLGASLVVVNPQAQDKSQALQDRHQLGFEILCDETQEVLRAFNLQFAVPPAVQTLYQGIGLNLPEHTANGSWNLPVPATFVLDREGVVQARHVDVDYSQRMEPSVILAAVQSLRS